MEFVRPTARGSGAADRGPGGRSLLVVAHPGHELRLFGWLCEVRPDVLVLTDGSGRGGAGRIENSRRLLQSTGARPGPIFGAYSDQQIYTAMLTGNMSIFVEMALTVAAVLRCGGYRAIVADPFEGYNPTHDLCRVLIDAAAQGTRDTSGSTLLNYDYALTEMSDFRECESLITMKLGAQMSLRKRMAAAQYTELMGEVRSAVQREGNRAYDQEVLREIGLEPLPVRPLDVRPFYETYGEKQCAAGRYSKVIRYARHFCPVAQAIGDAVRSTQQLPAKRIAR